MQFSHIDDIEVGTLVRAVRKHCISEPKTLWAIKAQLIDPESNAETAALFWLEPPDDEHPPGFDVNFRGNVLVVSPSLKIEIDLESSEMHDRTLQTAAQGLFGPIFCSGGYKFTGVIFNDSGERFGGAICSLEGEVTRLDNHKYNPACVTFSNWSLVPSQESEVVQRRPEN